MATPHKIPVAESPRSRRYGSDGPVLTPGQLSQIVSSHEKDLNILTVDDQMTSWAVPFDPLVGRPPPVAPIHPVGEAPAQAPVPPLGIAPPVTPVHPVGEAPPEAAVPPVGIAPPEAPVPPVGEAPPEAPAPPVGIAPPPPAQARPYRRCVVRRACGCLTLQQGAYAIGVMQVTVGIVTLLLEALYLMGVLVVGAFALQDDLTGNLGGPGRRWGPTNIAYASLSGFLLLQDIFTLFFAGLLLHGAKLSRPGYVRAWLVYTGVGVALAAGTWAGRLTLEFLYKPWAGAALLVRCLIYLSPPVYFLVVVRSFYYQLLDERAAVVPLGEPPKGEGEGEEAPLMRPPPAYAPVDPLAAPPPQPPAPLETDLDARDDLEAGFGPHWRRPPGPGQVQQRVETLERQGASPEGRSSPSPATVAPPRVVAALGRDGSLRALPDHPAPPASASADEEDRGEDYDEVEVRPISRRLPGVGPMVLPPLPPGHRESLQHVAKEQQQQQQFYPSHPSST